jgi:hypothetical protein
METKESRTEILYNLLRTKSAHKQKTYRNTIQVFEMLKEVMIATKSDLASKLQKDDPSVIVDCKDRGAFELEIKFGGDLLILNMHTNVFKFQDSHFIAKHPYVLEDPMRGYFGMINIYNFLADSYKYNRLNDLGFLIGRIFVNSENHFFMDGQDQLGFLYNDIESQVVSEDVLFRVVQTAMIYAVDLDLEVPPIEKVAAITLHQKLSTRGNEELKTGKKVGYGYSNMDSTSIQ